MKATQTTSENQSDVMDPARAAAMQIAMGMEVDITDGAPCRRFFISSISGRRARLSDWDVTDIR